MRNSFTTKQDKKVRDLYLSGKTARQISKQFHVYPQSVLNSLKRTETPRRKDWARASGKDNGRWTGGVKTIKGYQHVFSPKHRLARKDGWVAVHRLKMEAFIKDKNNVVHHRDRNRLNNRRSNLKVYYNNGAHRTEHAKHQPREKNGRWYEK